MSFQHSPVPHSNHSRRLGRSAENLAMYFLVQRGWAILARGWQDRHGELDCIALEPKSRTIAFIEVKALTRESHHDTEEAVSYAKQTKIAKCANAWRQLHELQCFTFRFDVIGIVMKPHKTPRIRHTANAFSSQYFPY